MNSKNLNYKEKQMNKIEEAEKEMAMDYLLTH